MRIAVLGAGAVGGYFGDVLSRAGNEVAFLARGDRLRTLRQHGLRLLEAGGEFTVSPAIFTDRPEEVGSVDAVLVAVKAWQVRDVAPSILPMLTPSTRVLPLQNGVEAAAQLAEVLPQNLVLVGVCRIIVAVVAPGCVKHIGVPPAILLGELDGSPASQPTRALASALKDAGVSAEMPADIHAALWEKLVLIAALSGIGAVSRGTIGEVRQSPPTRELLRRMMEEVAAVARTREIRIDPGVVTRTLAFVDAMPPAGTASMQRDVSEGKPSELDAIIGVVVRLGRERGVPTPVSEFIYASLLPQESRARSAAAS